jgi:hypothetical protein
LNLPNSVRHCEYAISGTNVRTSTNHGAGCRAHKAKQRRLYFELALPLLWGMEKVPKFGMIGGSMVRALRTLLLPYIDRPSAKI